MTSEPRLTSLTLRPAAPLSCSGRVLRWPARVAIGLEAVVLLVVGFLPPAVPDVIVTACISFVAAVQISCSAPSGRGRTPRR